MDFPQMPHRPTSHVIGDLAVNQIESLFLSQGWAVDRIQRDYGEDLLVQTTLHGVVDPYKVLVQVKGSRQKPKKKFEIDAAHLWRWRYNSELVILVQWNVDSKSGLYSIPEQLPIGLNDRSLKLAFNEADRADEPNCAKIAWKARVRHWGRVIAIQENRMDLNPEAKNLTDSYWRVSYELVNVLGITSIDPVSTHVILSDDARKMISRVYRNLRGEGRPHQEAWDTASFLGFMFMYVKTTKLDLDMSIVRAGASITRNLMGQDFELKEVSQMDTEEVMVALAKY